MYGRVISATVALTLACAAQASALTSIADLGSLGSMGLRFDGGTPSELSGFSVSTGDVDGDGIGDLLIGALGLPGAAGEAYLVLGATSLTSVPDLDNPPPGVTVRRYGGGPGERAGGRVLLADVIGDSRDDIVIGAPGASPGGRAGAGSVYVIPGTAAPASDNDLTTLPAGAVRLDGDEAGDGFGRALAGGDVSGDAKGDLVVGAPAGDPQGRVDAGWTYVFGGPVVDVADAGTLPAGASRLGGASAGEQMGFSVAVGNMMGTPKEDLLTGAPGFDSNRGVVVGFEGKPVFPSHDNVYGTADFASSAIDPGERAGAALAMGNVFYDGYEEYFSGGPGADRVAVCSVQVGCRFYRGQTTGEQFGASVAASNVTGSSYDDVIVGAPFADPGGRSDAGRTYVIPAEVDSFGLGAVPASVATYDGDGPGDRTGFEVAGGDDVNGDLRQDAVLGAPGADPFGRADAGTTFLIFGDNVPPTASLSGAPDPVVIGEQVTWSATGADPEGGPVVFAFDVDQQPGFEVPFGASNSTTRTYLSTGTKTGTVRVRDVGGATTDASDTVEVVAGLGGATSCTGAPVTIGTNGPDTMSGGYGSQVLVGLGGADDLSGGYDNDCVIGNGGSDSLDGGYGDDFVYGGAGQDELKGGYGNDVLDARDGAGGDVVNCGAGSADVAYVDPGDTVKGCETVS